MSSRPQLKPFPVISAQSMAASVTSVPSIIGQITFISYSISWTGAPVGAFNVEVCNDAQFDPNGAYISGTGNWKALPLDSTITASGSADTAVIELDGVAAAYIRLHYIFSSGSGTLNATVAGKCA